MEKIFTYTAMLKIFHCKYLYTKSLVVLISVTPITAPIGEKRSMYIGTYSFFLNIKGSFFIFIINKYYASKNS